MAEELHPAFCKNKYLFRRKVFKIFGGAFHAYDQSGNLAFYSEQKAFKLKEDFRIYGDENMTEELLVIKTPQIFDIGATYYVLDPIAEEGVGAVRRSGIKSMFKDEYIFLDENEKEIGKLRENSWFSAFASRFLKLIPQKYICEDAQGAPFATCRQHFNPFVLKYTLQLQNPDPPVDRRLLLAGGILLAGIEGRQQ
ncbi:MAG: hypothetical protein ACLFWL_08635 [Candidatus Brocadiia bacterium]